MLEKWFDGASYLVSDDLISYHSFFTTIFAELAFIWAFGIEGAMTYTWLLVGALANVLIIAALKGSIICNRDVGSIILSAIYVAIFMGLIICACIMDVLTGILLFAIPFAWTGFTVWIRGFQDSVFAMGFAKWVYKVANFIHKPVVMLISQFVVLLAPVIALAWFGACTDMALWLKILLPILAAMLGPVWAYIEDSWATQSIFELAYELN
ncbi:MAG: hypothetical protein IKJ32_06845 [Clostridia bacterium]|nr:hypothetical protein [Clostridia bacterium]